MLCDPDGHIAFLTACFIVGAVTLAIDWFSGAAQERANTMLNDPSLYNIANWATAGLVDTVKGAVAPEKPLSAEHWIDSAATASLIVGAASKIAKIGTAVKASHPTNPGSPFKAGKTGFQYGVDPNTLIPSKDLSTLDSQRISDAVKFGGNHSVIVGKTGIIQDGHHRVADAIKNGRAIDIFVEPYK